MTDALPMLGRRTVPLALAAAAMLMTAAAQASAQQTAEEWLERCRRDDGRRASNCEVREQRLPVSASFNVSARPNGSVWVEGWDRQEVLVRVRIRADARTQEEADRIAREITLDIAQGRASASGPRNLREAGWSVSFDVFVPRTTDINAESTNGSIGMRNLAGRLEMSTTNGSINVERLSGDVRGRTTNGSLTVALSGNGWDGSGLDLRTVNGAVSLTMPDGYSARLTAETVNGAFSTDFPITVQGRIGRRVEADLGRGGAPVRVSTTNGAIRLRRG